MMTQVTRRGRVKAAFQNDNDLKPLLAIIEPSSTSDDRPLTEDEQDAFLGSANKILNNVEYDMLLQHLHTTGRMFVSVRETGMRDWGTQFLYTQVHNLNDAKVASRTFSRRTSHEGNSGIQFINPTTQQPDTGFIEGIWRTLLNSNRHLFFIVAPHKRLPIAEEQKTPFFRFNKEYATRVVDVEPSGECVIIEQHQIITHLSTYRRPAKAKAYGIERDILVVCWALNRGRR